jgi:hypothetical protein
MTDDVVSISDRRYWPTALDRWQNGIAARAPEHLTRSDGHAAEWRDSMRRLAAHVGTTVAIPGGGHTATANDGYPLALRTAAQRAQFDQLASAAD